MFRGFLPSSLLGLLFVSSFSASCGSRKSDEVAVEAASPPPAAYPTTPEGYADSYSTGSSASPTSSPSSMPSAPTPEPPSFQLRAGETMVSYRIESGDNLSAIATKYNTSVSRIQAANGMSDTKIFAGKTLQIPTAAPPGLAMNASTASAAGSYSGARNSYGSGSAPTAPSSVGSYPSTASAPSYPSTTTSAPSYPSTTSSSPASTSYPRVDSPPVPPQPQQAAGAFPTPNFGGGGGIQFSE